MNLIKVGAKMKISIIVPVYNVQNYISDCIESILCQSTDDYEIILIDDGSTDKSGEICDDYAIRFEQIHVYHQRNQGQAAARNFGVEKSKGEYIWFVDADDFLLEKDSLEVLIELAKDSPNIIAFGWKQAKEMCDFKSSISVYSIDDPSQRIWQGKEYVMQMLNKSPISPWYPWAYLFQKQYWIERNFQFKSGIKYEDLELIYLTILNAESIKFVEKAFYGYRVGRPGSTLTNLKLSTLQDGIFVIAENIKKVKSDRALDENLQTKLCNNFACNYFSLMIASTKLLHNDKKKFRKILKEHFWIADYACSRYQKWLKRFASIFGICITQKLLEVRRFVKSQKAMQ